MTTSTMHRKHRQYVQALLPYARPNTFKGVGLYLGDIGLYALAVAGVLFLPWLPAKILASLVAGLKLTGLAELGHEAAHNSLTKSRRLNWLLGVLSFTPCLFNYRLWVYDHHVLHHPNTNGEHVDTYRPLSKAEYDALTPWQQRLLRFYRSTNPLAYGVYYIFHRWSRVKIMPGAFLPAMHRASAWKHFAFVALYFVGFMSLLLNAPRFAPVDAPTAVLLGWALPFFVFQTVMSLALYLNHTHPAIPWFSSKTERYQKSTPEMVSLHLQLPRPLGWLTHYYFEHPAHHVYPAIPCYEIWEAQQTLNRMMGEDAVIEPLSWQGLARIMRTCKLYDYEKHQWLDYEGRPTTPVLLAQGEGGPVPLAQKLALQE